MERNTKDTMKFARGPDENGSERLPSSTEHLSGASMLSQQHDPMLSDSESFAFDTLDIMGAVWLSDTVGTWQWDLRTDKCFWNKRMFELLGLDPATSDASGTTFFAAILSEDRPRVHAAVLESTKSRGKLDEEFRIARPDGEIRWLLARAIALHDERGVPTEMLGVNIDVTNRKRDETEMQKVNVALENRLRHASEAARRRSAQLERLAAQITQAELAERKRIASLLHDNVQQTLIAAILGAEKARRQVDNAGARQTLQKVIKAIQEVVAKTRLLSIQLDPPVLAHATLSESLRWLAQSKHEQFGLRVSYQPVPGLDASFEKAKYFVFEAARELLFNVVKHSGVNAASMTLEISDGLLRLSVDDGGQGCALESLRERSPDGGMGLAMIAERAAIMGGDVRFRSAPGAGFHVVLTIPVEVDEDSS